MHQRFADDLWAEIHRARTDGREVSLIVPLGPVGQYPILAKRLNEARMPLDHVTFFGMDEWLDWQGLPFAADHPFSLEGRFHQQFIDLIEPDLRPPLETLIFPSPLALDRSSEELARRDNLALSCGGIGFQGHVAFNEPPASPVDIRDRGRATRFADPPGAAGCRYHYRTRPALGGLTGLRRSAHGHNARAARLAFRAASPALYRHRNVEADNPADSAFCRPGRRLPGDAFRRPPRCLRCRQPGQRGSLPSLLRSEAERLGTNGWAHRPAIRQAGSRYPGLAGSAG